MANIKLSKTVYSKADIDKAIDKEFTTFVVDQQEESDTIEELFRLYNKFFYEIPATGDANSHEFLIRESSKMVELEKEDLEVQPLLDEIAELRERLLLQQINSIQDQQEILLNVVENKGTLQNSEELLNNLRGNIENLQKEKVEAPKPLPSAQQTLRPYDKKIGSNPLPPGKKRRTNNEVKNEVLRLKREGFIKEDISRELKIFGASKWQRRIVGY